MFWFDPMYLVFALPALLLAFYAQIKVQSAYNTYLRIQNRRGITGLQAAQQLLLANGLGHVNIEGVPGQLTDHYDPRSDTLRLSEPIARGSSVAALGVVAHEIGHALQDNQQYMPMRLRTGLVPIVNVGSWLGPIIFFLGLLMQIDSIAWLGLVLFAGAAFFAVLTLPIELNASQRAMRMLTTSGLVVDAEEARGARAVLDAAALTYVAAVAQAISTLLYYSFLLLSGRRRR
ncbi:MAG: zinc metallopeptidase [Chloroflexi bacterium]|nr:zinc metallopeptidase [Chloroflexota bacterium]